eukprot:maker-scaffold_36-snap-gene-1.0-mRNA-1 protein AED:0.00 eAED:0.00 QI:411/1/1/1/1/1/2/347/268
MYWKNRISTINLATNITVQSLLKKFLLLVREEELLKRVIQDNNLYYYGFQIIDFIYLFNLFSAQSILEGSAKCGNHFKRRVGLYVNKGNVGKRKIELVNLNLSQQYLRRKIFHILDETNMFLFCVPLIDLLSSMSKGFDFTFFEESLLRFRNIFKYAIDREISISIFFNNFNLFYNKYFIEGIPLVEVSNFRTPPVYDEEENSDLSCTKAREWILELFLREIPPKYREPISICFGTAISSQEVFDTVIRDLVCYEVLKYPYLHSRPST